MEQLCPTNGSWGACGPVEDFVMPNLGFRCSKSILHMTTCTYFNNLEFDIFDADLPQCHFIISVTIAVRNRTLAVY